MTHLAVACGVELLCKSLQVLSKPGGVIGDHNHASLLEISKKPPGIGGIHRATQLFGAVATAAAAVTKKPVKNRRVEVTDRDFPCMRPLQKMAGCAQRARGKPWIVGVVRDDQSEVVDAVARTARRV